MQCANGPTLVAILVTHDAVDDVEKATAGDGGPLARVSKHRDRFELAASTKHQRGQFEEDGSVTRNAGGCPTRPSLAIEIARLKPKLRIYSSLFPRAQGDG